MNQEKQKAKVYSAEFRESSVKLAIDSDQPIAQTAKDLGDKSQYATYLDQQI